MKNILIVLAFLFSTLLLLFSASAHAGTFGKYGKGIDRTAEYGTAAVKNFSFGCNKPWYGPFMQQYELGLFADSSGHERSSSAYGFYSLGVEVAADPVVIRSLWGVGAISTPDDMLGGRFQFTQDLLLGLRDKRGNLIGVDYKHISSAGIYDPNKGRDFITIQVEVLWR